MMDRPSKRKRPPYAFQCCLKDEDLILLQSPEKSQLSHVELSDDSDVDISSVKPSHRSPLNSTFKSNKSADHCGETSLKGKLGNENVLERVLCELSKIRKTQQRIEQQMNIFLKRNTSHISAVGMDSDSELDFRSFPLASVEDLQQLDDAISKQENRKQLLQRLILCGGLSYDNHTKRILKFLLTDSLGENYSWHGAKGKLKFVNLRLPFVIIDAVVQAFKGTVTEALVEEVIKAWLRHCKERRIAAERKSGVYEISKET